MFQKPVQGDTPKSVMRPRNLFLIALILLGTVPISTRYKRESSDSAINNTASSHRPSTHNSKSLADTRSDWTTLRKLYGKPETRAAEQEGQQRIRDLLQGMEQTQAVEFIRAYLSSGLDQNLSAPFQVGKGGVLASSPTMRVLLLDLLGALDAEMAAQTGRTIFESKTSADEWAICLRNSVWYSRQISGAESMAEYQFVRSKVDDMFSHRPWLDQPTDGFLESFDFWVEFGDQTSLATVLKLHSSENSESIKHAAQIASHQITAKDPKAVIEYLCSSEGLAKVPPIQAGVLLAKADPRDPTQLEIIKHTIKGRSQDDLMVTTFFEYFPNFQQYAVEHLVAASTEPIVKSARSRAVAARERLQVWQIDSQLDNHRKSIVESISYLNSSLKH